MTTDVNIDNDEVISLDDLIEKNKDGNQINELEIEPTENLYQVTGTTGSDLVNLRYLGKHIHRPIMILDEFSFGKHHIKILSYLLSDADLNDANEKCMLKMIGILIKKSKYDKDPILAITMSFYTFVHKKDKKNISDYVSTCSNENKLKGFFGYELIYCTNAGEIKHERIGKLLDVYPGRTKSIYNLIEFLSHEKVVSLVNF